MWLLLLVALACLTALYLHLLARRLRSSHFDRATCGVPFPTEEEILRDSAKCSDIDPLADSRISGSTGKTYLVTGAAGNVGSYMVQLLHKRGERRIYCLDVCPLPAFLADLDGVIFRRCDIGDPATVDAIFTASRPDVWAQTSTITTPIKADLYSSVIHICSAIRFWERWSFTRKYSTRVNVEGTRNIISSIQSLAPKDKRILLYCSSTDACLAEPKFMRLGIGRTAFTDTYPLSDDRPVTRAFLKQTSYAVTKRAAEDIVRRADKVDGVRTGIVRVVSW